MPVRRRRPQKKRPLRRRPVRKAQIMPAIAEKGQTCRVIETFEAVDLNSNQGTQHIFTLAQFARASNIAPNFKWYRAARVTWTYDPLYNTFQDGVNAASKPYMYTVMNRSQQENTTTMGSVQQFQCAGARPVPFVSQKKISYKPNWCSPGLLQVRTTNPPGGTQIKDYSSNGLQPQYGWLATPNNQPNVLANQVAADSGDYPTYISNPPTGSGLSYVTNSFVYNNMVVYNGHHTFIDQKYTGGETPIDPVARLTVTVVWEFKGASNNLGMGAPPPSGVTIAPKDAPLAPLAGAEKKDVELTPS